MTIHSEINTEGLEAEFIQPRRSDDMIKAQAGEASGEQNVGRNADDAFDTVNPGYGYSDSQEGHLREKAVELRGQASGLRAEAEKYPYAYPKITTDQEYAPTGQDKLWGIAALILKLLILVSIPLVVAAGIQESGAIRAVVESLYFGIPFAFPALAGILATSLIRRTLHGHLLEHFDRGMGIVMLPMLALWVFMMCQTFLVPMESASGGGWGGVQQLDLSYYYMAHFGAEVIAAMGLQALSERCFYGGNVVVMIPSAPREDLLTKAAGQDEEALKYEVQADHIAARRQRYASSKAACRNDWLAFHAKCQKSRAAALAQADAQSCA